jgi:hypothetical protein
MDALRSGFAAGGVAVPEALRIDEGRYWSYMCTEPACHPVEGTPLETEHPDGKVLDQIGTAAPARADLAARFAPVEGEARERMQAAYQQAREAAADDRLRREDADIYREGRGFVSQAIGTYREGGELSDDEHARLGVALTDIRLRDEAWSRMDPEHAEAHSRLWTDATRRAELGFVAAPASLLASTEFQQGNGVCANMALERATADNPRYSMARLLGQALDAGVPPSKMVPPMTPRGSVGGPNPRRQASVGLPACGARCTSR